MQHSHVVTKTVTPAVQVLPAHRTMEDVEFFLNEVVGPVWDAIHAGHFPANPTSWLCGPKYCDFYPHCRNVP